MVLVVHDWGSALGFDWAYRHPAAVRGIVYMEAFVKPISSWSEWPEGAVEFFQAIRSDSGEEMVFERNIVLENFLPAGCLRKLSDATWLQGLG